MAATTVEMITVAEIMETIPVETAAIMATETIPAVTMVTAAIPEAIILCRGLLIGLK